MDPIKILVIEDDSIVARTIERSLRGDEFKVTLANRGEKGLQLIQREPPDLVILDIIMPDMDGYSVCRQMRANPGTSNIPILFLTARVKPQDRIDGFVAGADDYLCKPFNVDELVMRVRAILRRFKPHINTHNPWPVATLVSENCLTVGGFILDTRKFELTTPDRGKIHLTPLQYDLLYHLMAHPGEPFSPARLLDEVWDYPAGKGSPDLVRVHIKTLRERVESNPRSPTFIRTVPGRGYTVEASI